MKKILAGMLYRLIKGYEFWGLMVLVLISAFYLNYVQFDNNLGIDASPDTSVYSQSDNSAGSIDDYLFAGLGISAYDLYRADSEILPDDVFERLYRTDNIATSEIWFLFNTICGTHAFPILLIIIFIPLFFGRLFSDGTIRNLISSGHSKARIYLASLSVMAVIDILIILINIMAFALLCLVSGWKPPIYLPVVLLLYVIELLSIITVSALCIAALFITMKRTAAFIVSFVIGVMTFVPISSMAAVGIQIKEWRYDYQRTDYQIYIDNYSTYDWNHIEQHLNVLEFSKEIYLDGHELKVYDDTKMPAAIKTASMALIYLDPFMTSNLFGDPELDMYMLYRDGLMAINVGNNIFWIALATACGIVIFKKREIR